MDETGAFEDSHVKRAVVAGRSRPTSEFLVRHSGDMLVR